jgi:prepilin-type N-terminal cleavage/methylation domain-containing protein
MKKFDFRYFRVELSRGFTLIETVIVILIASIVLTAIVTLARPYFEERQRQISINAVRNVERALANYVEQVGAYPCPAPLTSQRGTEEDGKASCTAGAGIQQTAGRDGHAVLIGAVPYRDLGISVGATIDAQSNRLTYAVSLRSTTTAYNDGIDTNGNGTVMDDHTGAIEVVDESGTSLLEKNDTAESEAGSAHVFFFSHGRNGAGAFTDSGVQTADNDCTKSVDDRNCDGDGVFVAALQSHGTNSQYYDDVSVYSLMVDGEDDDLWDRTPANPNDIYNLNTENVGIGTETPDTKLDVIGSVTVQDGWLVMRNSGDPVANPNHYPQIRFLHPKAPFGPSPLEDWASIGIARENNTGVAGLALSGQNNLNGTNGIQDVHLFVANNGEVGINTTEPLARLHLVSPPSAVPMIKLDRQNWGSWDLSMDNTSLFLRSADTTNIPLTIYETGNIGVMTQTPKTRLDVAGEIKIGNEGLPPGCASDKEGAMRYNPTIKNIQFCDGVNWKSPSASLVYAGENGTLANPVHTFTGLGTLQSSSTHLAVPENGKWAVTATFMKYTTSTSGGACIQPFSVEGLAVSGDTGNSACSALQPGIMTFTWIGEVTDGNIKVSGFAPNALVSWHAIKVQ